MSIGATAFTFPSNYELYEVGQELIQDLTYGDRIFELFPIVNTNADVVQWDQLDDYLGIQAYRGKNGEPVLVKSPTSKRWQMTPGYYGDFSYITEEELTSAARLGTRGQPVDITYLVRMHQDKLLTREVIRVRKNLWDLLYTGSFTTTDRLGNVIDRTVFKTTTVSAAVSWQTYASATPLVDLRNMALQGRGSSSVFNREATIFMNRKTCNWLLNNTNASDIGGKRLQNGSSILSLDDVNRILAADDLPQIEIYEKAWKTDAGVTTLFVPDGAVIMVGQRPNGERVGAYQMTINANNPDLAPGSYTLVQDSSERGMSGVPRQIRCDQGHNGGPAIEHPSAVVNMNAT